MKEIFRIIVSVLNLFSLLGVMLAGLFGVLCEIIGFAKFQSLLSSIGFIKSFEQTWTISLILLLFFVATCYLKNKL